MSLSREASHPIEPSVGESSGKMIAITPDELRDVYRRVETDMAQVGEIIRDNLRHSNPIVDEVLRYSVQLGGKRLRPLLVLLCARACGGVCREHRLIAAALEMIHTGTLIHDDILDGAEFRRHLKTINLRWDSQYAVLVGDLLLTKAISLITDCADQETYNAIADACRRTCEGELLQTSSRGRFDMSLDDYWKIIGGKTASLIETACRLGTAFSGQTPETTAIFARFGRLLGLAFQIFDDVLDLVGTPDKTGKTLGTDLLNQKPTLPLIHYLETATPRDKETMLLRLKHPNFNESDADDVREILETSGAIAFACRTATDFISEGLALLDTLSVTPDSSQNDARRDLQKVARFIVKRNL